MKSIIFSALLLLISIKNSISQNVEQMDLWDSAHTKVVVSFYNVSDQSYFFWGCSSDTVPMVPGGILHSINTSDEKLTVIMLKNKAQQINLGYILAIYVEDAKLRPKKAFQNIFDYASKHQKDPDWVAALMQQLKIEYGYR